MHPYACTYTHEKVHTYTKKGGGSRIGVYELDHVTESNKGEVRINYIMAVSNGINTFIQGN